jgi:hypothetical protein
MGGGAACSDKTVRQSLGPLPGSAAFRLADIVNRSLVAVRQRSGVVESAKKVGARPQIPPAQALTGSAIWIRDGYTRGAARQLMERVHGEFRGVSIQWGREHPILAVSIQWGRDSLAANDVLPPLCTRLETQRRAAAPAARRYR